jgi:hypothetical protein
MFKAVYEGFAHLESPNRVVSGAMGQLDSTRTAPPRRDVRPLHRALRRRAPVEEQHGGLQGGLALFTTLLFCVKTRCNR